MAVKEASIVAGIAGGASGAGASYATNNFGFGFGVSYVRDANFSFVLLGLGCVDKNKFPEGEVKKLVQQVPASAGTTPTGNLDSNFDAKSGCFKIQSYSHVDGQQTKFSRIGLELVAWDKEEESARNKGIVIWSSLFPNEDQENKKNTVLKSRIFYLTKEGQSDGKFVAKKGLEFTTTIEGEADKTALMGWLKEAKDSTTDEAMNLNAKKEYTWASGSEFEFLGQIKIVKDQGSIPLFFGRDFDGDKKLDAKMTGVYDLKQGWRKSDNSDGTITNTIFDKSKKGKWTLKP